MRSEVSERIFMEMTDRLLKRKHPSFSELADRMVVEFERQEECLKTPQKAEGKRP